MTQALILILHSFSYYFSIVYFHPISLKKVQKIILLFLISACSVITKYYFTNYGVLIFIIVIYLYLICIIKQQIRNTWNLLIIYLFSFLWNHCFTLLWSFFKYKIPGLQSSSWLYVLYTLNSLMLLYLFCYTLSNIVRTKMIDLLQSIILKRIVLLIALNTIIFFLICSFSFVVGKAIGYTHEIMIINTFLFGCYFLISTFLLANTLKNSMKKNRFDKKLASYQDLLKYTNQLEAMYYSIRDFQHDYMNIIESLSRFIKAKNFEGLTDYFNEEVLPISLSAASDTYRLHQLANIHIIELKSILLTKIIYAYENGIDVSIEIINPIDSLKIDILDLTRIIGIFLDNAVEATLETENPELSLAIVKGVSSTAIIISNTFLQRGFSNSDFKKAAFSTKGEQRGIGLHTASNIIGAYTNIIWDTEMIEDLFVQRLIINEVNK